MNGYEIQDVITITWRDYDDQSSSRGILRADLSAEVDRIEEMAAQEHLNGNYPAAFSYGKEAAEIRAAIR